MYLRSIQLENYRNYRRLDIDVEPSINVFFGQNAQGKTNIVEAIYLCACARSHRTSKDRDLIFHGENYYKVALSLVSERNSEEYEESVSLLYADEDGKKAKRTAYQDGVPFEKISDYLGIFHAVIFAPEDLQLVKEGPSVRRRYLDILISQVKPSYFHLLMTYSRLLLQRNKVLKNLKLRGGPHRLSSEEEKELEIWDYPLAESGARIIADRIRFSERVKQIAKLKHSQISEEKEILTVKYRTVSGILSDAVLSDSYQHAGEIEKLLLNKLLNSHQEDYDKGTTYFGPHRDDVELLLNNENLRLFASQGQQRSAALSLKLAELVILREETKEMPILLLDDVFSELDEKRRACLLENIENAQVFVTCTDRFFLETLLSKWNRVQEGKIAFFEVSEGSVNRLS